MALPIIDHAHLTLVKFVDTSRVAKHARKKSLCFDEEMLRLRDISRDQPAPPPAHAKRQIGKLDSLGPMAPVVPLRNAFALRGVDTDVPKPITQILKPISSLHAKAMLQMRMKPPKETPSGPRVAPLGPKIQSGESRKTYFKELRKNRSKSSFSGSLRRNSMSASKREQEEGAGTTRTTAIRKSM